MAHPDRLQHEIDRLMRDHEAHRDEWLRRLDGQLQALGLHLDQLPPPDGATLGSLRQGAERSLAASLPAHAVRELLAPAHQLQAEAESQLAAATLAHQANPQPPVTSMRVRRRVAASGV